MASNASVRLDSSHNITSQRLQVAMCNHNTHGNVTSAGWQVTLCDPMWHVSSRSGVATLRTDTHL